MFDQSLRHRILCYRLIAVDVIVNDHNLSPSRAVQVMKGSIAWLQATINNQRSFPMPDIWFRVSALAQGGILSSRLVVKYCEQGQRLTNNTIRSRYLDGQLHPDVYHFLYL